MEYNQTKKSQVSKGISTIKSSIELILEKQVKGIPLTQDETKILEANKKR